MGKINPSKIDMKTAVVTPTEWLEKFIVISKELKFVHEFFYPNDNGYDYYYDDDDDDDDDEDDDDDDDADAADADHNHNDDGHFCGYSKGSKKQQAVFHVRMTRMAPLFASQPRLKKICDDWDNNFLSSCFSKYKLAKYKNDSGSQFLERLNDMEYLINLCGTNLTELNVNRYPTSQIMPIINANCPNLDTLSVGFKEIMSQDFENVFSNMSRLETLKIMWRFNHLTPPMTLVKSLEQVGGTLTSLHLLCDLEPSNISLPDSLALVFPQLIVLRELNIKGFGLSQLLLQSIGQMKNLIYLSLTAPSWRKDHPTFDTRTSMHPIGYLKNLEILNLSCDFGIRDEFLINLANNATNLTTLYIIGTDITDIGMSAIDNLKQLEELDLGLSSGLLRENTYITDESIKCLFNPKLSCLDLNYCINITDESLMELVKNMPNLKDLNVENTRVTRNAVHKVYKLSRNQLTVYHN